jgi:hypothetical protein
MPPWRPTLPRASHLCSGSTERAWSMRKHSEEWAEVGNDRTLGFFFLTCIAFCKWAAQTCITSDIQRYWAELFRLLFQKPPKLPTPPPPPPPQRQRRLCKELRAVACWHRARTKTAQLSNCTSCSAPWS